ncbi:MAG: DUF4345 domain-containing protein [Candidatus Thiodiazotropha lotti]|uniref:DUF4345 domain-containing protein n=1 Tax=Candidatus Thiodiazotropha endoloripes TaxID=1818881 RepID=UPI00083DD52D|nr:DUF4345 domain-containing protein [Candidatus Thiodiazotropha endoloripes]MCG7896920.1 DUF4345 domain-containing protein [Candidatus Thiodiazotropha weberae]MCG7992626.1 DUF4345 domain-containing protein [Candidatus Thiodiazotropha lotti]MCG7900978.1 DUF4345 domain-containing protein [Candidatus Thiodiazotropha weberae]MCG7914263.1 DUF4345 domain-containing protein [Candidatus Thiodiazotropha weberae]MCG8000067.1 DUF4345 domain-containing protein [Candidatus Thiodiazotropha lotti]
MQKRHKRLLVALLMLFGLSLLVPGAIAIFHPEPAGLNTQMADQANQFRALHGMMAGLGVMACLACYRIERERTLVIGIGLTLALVVAARVYSLFSEGVPDWPTLFYLVIESILALIFLRYPPPADNTGALLD